MNDLEATLARLKEMADLFFEAVKWGRLVCALVAEHWQWIVGFVVFWKFLGWVERKKKERQAARREAAKEIALIQKVAEAAARAAIAEAQKHLQPKFQREAVRGLQSFSLGRRPDGGPRLGLDVYLLTDDEAVTAAADYPTAADLEKARYTFSHHKQWSKFRDQFESLIEALQAGNPGKHIYVAGFRELTE